MLFMRSASKENTVLCFILPLIIIYIAKPEIFDMEWKAAIELFKMCALYL